MKKKILLDLSFAHDTYGFSGIPQDTRWLFDNLCHSDKIETTGLIWQLDMQGFSLNPNDIADLNNLLSEDSRNYSRLNKLYNKILFCYKLILGNFLYNKLHLYKITNREIKEIIWRKYFSNTLTVESFARILDASYFVMKCNLVLQHHSKCVIDAPQDTDFVILQDARKLKIPPKTKKIIRYHDAIPIFAQDTNVYSMAKLHLQQIKSCANDSYFVCNSDSSLNDLGQLNENAAKKAYVIPYFIPKLHRVKPTIEILKEISYRRISKSTLDKNENVDEILEKWFKSGEKNHKLPKFIMTLSTIEPRKNIGNLIKAWSRINYEIHEIKLLIIGKPGWKYQDTLEYIKPFVRQGKLLHLESVAQDEIKYFYSAARCFIFPSVKEGFGIPPIEAMHCECPIVISDIPAHRYSAGNAALYFNPYDIEEMKEKIKTVINKERESEFIQDMIKKGLKNADRFSRENVLPMWEELFEKLS